MGFPCSVVGVSRLPGAADRGDIFRLRRPWSIALWGDEHAPRAQKRAQDWETCRQRSSGAFDRPEGAKPVTPGNSEVDTQEPVLALLGDPATHGGHTVKRIDTHAASLFLAGERAFKVKRAVRFPFLDFSTLAKRRAACEAEL